MDKAMRTFALIPVICIAYSAAMHAQPWEDVTDGPSGVVYSTATDNEHLIVTDYVYGRQYPYAVHRYDGNAWENISDSIIAVGANPIRALCLFRGVAYCYHNGGNGGLKGFFKREENSWEQICSMNMGGYAWGAKVYDDTLYIYGGFGDINGDTLLRNIVKYDGEQFYPAAAPLSYRPEVGLSPIVHDIHFYQGDLYAIGTLRTASGQYNIARWDGQQWNDVGSGLGYGNTAVKLLEYDGLLLIVNAHSEEYNGIANGMVAWDGQSFYGMGDGACEGAAGLGFAEVHDGKVFIAGTCNYPEPGWETYIAAYDGERWCRYPGTEGVRHMTSFQGEMYANLMHVEEQIPVYRFGRWVEETEAEWCGDFVNVGLDERNSETAELLPYPNPSTGPLSLSWSSTSAAAYTLICYDAQGREVHKHSGHTTTGNTTVQLELAHLPAGIYFGRLAWGDVVRSFQWMRA